MRLRQREANVRADFLRARTCCLHALLPAAACAPASRLPCPAGASYCCRRAHDATQTPTLLHPPHPQVTGPKDDLDMEWDGLLAAYRAHNGCACCPTPSPSGCARSRCGALRRVVALLPVLLQPLTQFLAPATPPLPVPQAAHQRAAAGRRGRRGAAGLPAAAQPPALPAARCGAAAGAAAGAGRGAGRRAADVLGVPAHVRTHAGPARLHGARRAAGCWPVCCCGAVGRNILQAAHKCLTWLPAAALRAAQPDDLLAALAQGSANPLLADAHITLLRLLQADMGGLQAAPGGQGCWESWGASPANVRHLQVHQRGCLLACHDTHCCCCARPPTHCPQKRRTPPSLAPTPPPLRRSRRSSAARAASSQPPTCWRRRGRGGLGCCAFPGSRCPLVPVPALGRRPGRRPGRNPQQPAPPALTAPPSCLLSRLPPPSPLTGTMMWTPGAPTSTC